MAIQIVMDRKGDTRHQFDSEDAAAVALAKDRFDRLTDQGYRAVALENVGGSGKLMSGFDPQVQRTLFIPQLKGG